MPILSTITAVLQGHGAETFPPSVPNKQWFLHQYDQRQGSRSKLTRKESSLYVPVLSQTSNKPLHMCYLSSFLQQPFRIGMITSKDEEK